MKIDSPKRQFIAKDLTIDSWESIEYYFEELLNRSIQTLDEFEIWLKHKSELDAFLEENAAWRYIKMTIDTRDEALSKSYSFFMTEIQPKITSYENKLTQKILRSPFVESLKSRSDYFIYLRSIETENQLYQEENVKIEAEISELTQEYSAISAAQMIEIDGQKMTMQQASQLLKSLSEDTRKTAFIAMNERRLMDENRLNDLYTKLISKRHQIALNAGFQNFRDYKFQQLGRFDYTQQDCFDFHASIKKHIVPLVREIQSKQAHLMNCNTLKPWNLEVDPSGKAALKPFESGQQLVDGTIQMFEKIDPFFADCIQTMEDMGHLDLESKEGKSPGGYNYPLYEIGVPFIFMNAVGALRDLVTMVHEGGHAIHSFLSRELSLTGFKNLPSEVAELASMSMELLSMDQWHVFFDQEVDLKRAKIEQLETILKILPWIATIDEFQHWVYENPTHSIEERIFKWQTISQEYGTGMVDWTGFENYKTCTWQRQLHLFEVPFYYIEYGIAQLGALAIWKNSKPNFQATIKNYKNALKLGYTKTIPEIYTTAGIEFNFSDAYVAEIAQFVKNEIQLLYHEKN